MSYNNWRCSQSSCIPYPYPQYNPMFDPNQQLLNSSIHSYNPNMPYQMVQSNQYHPYSMSYQAYPNYPYYPQSMGGRPRTSADTILNVMVNNVFLFTQTLLGGFGAEQRAALIGKSDYAKGHDVLIFCECFDNTARPILLNALKDEYPNQTPVVGGTKEGWDWTEGNYSSSPFVINGGVCVVSKWPIEQKGQWIYEAGCGADNHANKGFAFVRINKNGQKFDIYATHTQADDPGCALNDRFQIRSDQLNQLASKIEEMNSPNITVVGGDLNIIKGTTEYYNMINILKASPEPQYQIIGDQSRPYTYDTQTNSIAKFRDPSTPPQWLDYVLVSRIVNKPPNITVIDTVNRTPQPAITWTDSKGTFTDYSDHYPIYGTIQQG